MKRKYLGESHKKYSEACQKAVERMSKHPYTHEQCLEQVERLRKASELQGTPVSNSKQIAFFIFCIELYKRGHHLTGEQTYDQMCSAGVKEYIFDCYPALHTQGHNYILEDLNDFLKAKSTKPIHIGRNSFFPLLSCITMNVVKHIAKQDNISLDEATKAFYHSETYKELEKESTKMWHLGPAQLYENFKNESL